MNIHSLLPHLCRFVNQNRVREPNSFPLSLKPDVILTVQAEHGVTQEVPAAWIVPPHFGCDGSQSQAPVAAVPTGWGDVMTCRIDGAPTVLGWRAPIPNERHADAFAWMPAAAAPDEGEWIYLDT